MGKTQQAAGGGLTRADKAKLVPGNIRQGVALFEGTNRKVLGSYITPLHFGSLSVSGTGSGQTSQATLYMDCAGYSRLSFTVSSYINNVNYYIGSKSYSANAGQSVQADLNGAATCSLYIKAYSGSINDITLE